MSITLDKKEIISQKSHSLCKFSSALEQPVRSLDCNFDEEYICGWSNNQAKKTIPSNVDNGPISDWTRVKVGIGGKLGKS